MHPTLGSLALFLFAAPLAFSADADVITAFGPATTQEAVAGSTHGELRHILSGSHLGASPLSVDDEGLTHYAASHVYSFGVVEEPTTTTTYLTTPTTLSYTFRADASRYFNEGPVRGAISTGAPGEEDTVFPEIEGSRRTNQCVIQPGDSGLAVCEEEVVIPLPEDLGTGMITIIHRTYSGTPRPLYTGPAKLEDLEDSGARSVVSMGGAGVGGWIAPMVSGYL
ncbi:hypothetical protein CC1G_07789 [Coprinopsis cinerea okayama7|uniref:Uncharacterized protein n=1 Tax=Coprinopsis cinerea (strain Okayama-7 / 130 / ATCC MYA-4618 / FGSC 9003) TaxID=240176 RepID=A8NP19_COPC7|nr:hypothetical protein CC1G_07789 [Coprinopsis cinerea okayama7\|eukprot:XP_001835246.2 hypothetical protein CC1G_07789 [Coprinopsis cinerea okayama7\